MELDRSADPPPALWVATTKSSVNKWVSDVFHNLQIQLSSHGICSLDLGTVGLLLSI